MYDRILVPTDGSDEGEYALEYAVELARAHGAEIRSIYVIDSTSYRGLPTEAAWDGISDVLKEEGTTALERVRELVPDDIALETTIREGSPSQIIVEEATPENCDLVVMGTHGRNGIDRLLVGSVTERIVRRSSIPVLTVHLDEDKPEVPTAETQIPLE